MRIMWDNNEIPTVMEFHDIDFVPCWDAGKSTLEEPDNAEVMIDYEYAGGYDLDEISYEEAKQNYRYIVMNLLQKGYCRASDFEHFAWY